METRWEAVVSENLEKPPHLVMLSETWNIESSSSGRVGDSDGWMFIENIFT